MADILDILTIDEAKAAVNLPDQAAKQEDELGRFVTAVSRRIDDLCGPVVIREVTETLDADGGLLFLAHQEVSAITSVTEYQSGTGTVITAEDFDTAGGYRLRNGILERRSSWSATSWNGLVVVVYDAGRYASTGVVDAKFKVAAGSILRRLWKREGGTWAQSSSVFEAGEVSTVGVGFFKAVDPMVAELLGDELRLPSIA